MTTARQQQLQQWLAGVLGRPVPDLRPASADASLRRYWRLNDGARTLIAMDAPPPHEDTARFARLAAALRAVGLNTPELFAADHAQGFLLLGDLGEQPYLGQLHADSAERLYGDAIAALITLQASRPLSALPPYDEALLRRELAICTDWLLTALPGLAAVPVPECWPVASDRLVANALEQPRVVVHRDYHSRNLMLVAAGNPGILDFQDAVVGPVSYDLVSLLKDCYIDWPRARVEDWAWGYFDLAVQAGLLPAAASASFLRWFDLMGTQRHLKAAGIFARLAQRDGRPDYLQYLPRTLGYVVEVGGRYPELAALGDFVATAVLPRLPAAVAAWSRP